MADSEIRARRISGSLMSPFCPGKTLDACPSPYAGEWRGEIRAWTSQGMSDQEIVSRLSARVPGFDLTGRPGASWDWALPMGAMAVASGLLWIVVRRMRRAGRQEEHLLRAPAQSGPDVDARLDAELAAFDSGDAPT